MTSVVPRWQRILLKMGGEALSGESRTGILASRLNWLSEEVMKVLELGISMGIMVGGGNIWRGVRASKEGIDRATGDYMGMLATIINALALQDALEKKGIVTRIQSAVMMQEIAEPYIRRRALRHLEKGRVVIFAGGIGNPYFTTDTAAALRALEIGAQVLLKATKVAGIYSADPLEDKGATRYERIGYSELLRKQLKVMDSTAVSLCMDNRLPIVVFSLEEPGSIERIILGEQVGTIVE